MRRVAFAGPSIHGLPADLLDGIELRPPARRGDLPRAAEDGAEAVLLIDGFFGDGPTVGHKEILALLAAGVPTGGASSLGALRAAECAGHGMRVLGRIAEDYAAGRRTADADVAVLHAPAALGFRPLTLPLVDAEATLDALAGARPARLLDGLRASARALHFTRRDWPAVVAGVPGAPAGLAAWLARHAVSRKAEDARAALAWLRGLGERAGATPRGASGR